MSHGVGGSVMNSCPFIRKYQWKTRTGLSGDWMAMQPVVLTAMSWAGSSPAKNKCA
jgi:hypothetical protein